MRVRELFEDDDDDFASMEKSYEKKRLEEPVNDIQAVKDLTSALKKKVDPKTSVTLKIYYDDYSSIDEDAEEDYNHIMDRLFKRFKMKATDKDYMVWEATGVTVGDLDDIGDFFESEFNEPGYADPGDPWPFSFAVILS